MVEPREVVQTVLAVYMMQELDPRRFRTDAAFRSQLVRRVRGLTDLNAGSYYDDASGRMKRVYRDLSPRAVAVLGEWLATALGGPALSVAGLEVRDREAKDKEREVLRDAIADLR